MGLVQDARGAVDSFAEVCSATAREGDDLARGVRALIARLDPTGDLGASADQDLARARMLLTTAERRLASAASAARSAREPGQVWVDRALPG